MEGRHERVHEVDHFGFDPVSPTVHTKDRKKENNSACDPDTREYQNLNYEVATKLSFEDVEPHSEPKSRNFKGDSPNTPFKLPDKENTWETNNLWGFDPAVNPSQRSITSKQVRAQHIHDSKSIPLGRGFS